MKQRQTDRSLTSIPIEPRTIAGPVPLTAMQRKPWFYRQPGSLAPRTTCFGFRMIGILDIPVLQRSLNELVRRHESLRATIAVVDGVPTLCIRTVEEWQYSFLIVANAEEGLNEAQRHAQKFIDKKIDQAADPLFDALIIRVGDQDHFLVVSVDHIITDGISNNILKTELWTLYRKGLTGCSEGLPHPSLQFSDYAVWQQRVYPIWLRTHANYWRMRFTDAPGTRWPTHCEPDERRSLGFDAQQLTIEEKLTAEIIEFSRRTRSLPALVLLCAYVAVVSRWCNQYDLTIALIENGRHHPALTRMVGFLATYLHLRIEFDRKTAFLDLLALAKTEVRSAYLHRDFDWMPSLLPYFKPDLAFHWLPTTSDAKRTSHTESAKREDRLTIEPVLVSVSKHLLLPLTESMPFKMTLGCSLVTRELRISLNYRTHLLRAKDAQSLAEEMKSLLARAVSF